MGDGPCVHGVTFMRDCLRCASDPFDRRFTDCYVLLDAVVRFLVEDGDSVVAAKVAAEFGRGEAVGRTAHG
jgi:hypothetical protein